MSVWAISIEVCRHKNASSNWVIVGCCQFGTQESNDFVKYVRLKIWAFNNNHEVLMDSRAASYITRHFGSQYIEILSHKYIYAHI